MLFSSVTAAEKKDIPTAKYINWIVERLVIEETSLKNQNIEELFKKVETELSKLSDRSKFRPIKIVCQDSIRKQKHTILLPKVRMKTMLAVLADATGAELIIKDGEIIFKTLLE